METNNKYYTPSIEEFRIGFECEIYKNLNTLIINRINTKDSDWENSIIKHPMAGHMINWQNFSAIERIINMGSIRVKYLDKEDIKLLCEEFNCKFINTFKGPQGMERYDIKDSNGTLLFEYITRCMTNLRIGDINLFIKNKSELKVLLKQLHICQ